jgi:hypothetical protein
MEAMCSSEKSVEFQRTTRRYIPEDDALHNHGCENHNSYRAICLHQDLANNEEIKNYNALFLWMNRRGMCDKSHKPRSYRALNISYVNLALIVQRVSINAAIFYGGKREIYVVRFVVFASSHFSFELRLWRPSS